MGRLGRLDLVQAVTRHRARRDYRLQWTQARAATFVRELLVRGVGGDGGEPAGKELDRVDGDDRRARVDNVFHGHHALHHFLGLAQHTGKGQPRRGFAHSRCRGRA